MSIVDKLVYLVRQGAITVEQVAPEYREQVEGIISPPSTVEEQQGEGKGTT